jgi:hypothetical protein
MNKSDAITRIVQMQKLMERTDKEGEKEAALNMIVRLKAQFELTDRDIERRQAIEEAGGADARGFSMFGDRGHKPWFYEVRLKDYITTISDTIEEVLQIVATQDADNQVHLLCQVHDALRAVVDKDAKDASWSKLNVGRARNEAIRRAYQEQYERFANEGRWGMTTEDPRKLHEWAVDAVTSMAGYPSNLTKVSVEAAVGVRTADVAARHWKAEPIERSDDGWIYIDGDTLDYMARHKYLTVVRGTHGRGSATYTAGKMPPPHEGEKMRAYWQQLKDLKDKATG